MAGGDKCMMQTDPNGLKRDGTSRKQRFPVALDPASAPIDERTPEQLIAFAGAHGYDTARVPATPDPALAAIRDTLLEVRDLEVSLLPVGSKVNPMRWLVLGARTRLVRTVDGTVLDDRIVSDPLGPALDLGEWTANRAARFREEVERAGPRLAEQIVTGLFMA